MCDCFEIDCIKETSLHAYLIFFTRSRLQGNVKIVLKIEYVEPFQELVLKKYVEQFSAKIIYVMLIISLPEAVLREM